MDLKKYNSANFRIALEGLARQFRGSEDSNTERRHRVLRAIERIDNGSYGVCEGCGNAIDEERLEIIPEATHCVSCQRVRERLAESRLKDDSPNFFK